VLLLAVCGLMMIAAWLVGRARPVG
jgi:hypothetical protein